MSCAAVQPLIESLVDGELDANQQALLLEHLDRCPGCKLEYQRLERLQSEIRAHATYYRAPDQLRLKVIAGLPSPAARRRLPWVMLAAASVILALSLSVNFELLGTRKADTEIVAQEVFSGHMRSVLGTHLFDVASSDRHTVKPWFTGKLNFAPDVKDLSSQGFPLSGGRVDYLAGRPVAALVFRRGDHVINLFTWPSPDGRNAEIRKDGFTLLEWSHGGMTYWAVSDVSIGELKNFEQLYKLN